MNNKTAMKYRVVFYLCILVAVACLVVGFCTINTVEQNGWYRNKYNVALYIYEYHCLPDNFITKDEAAKITDGNTKIKYNIGGDTFYNREGIIDNPNNIALVECDIYTGNNNISSRGAERIVYFTDGSLVLYTSDHYSSFTPITKWDIMWNINTLSCILFSASGALLLTQLIVAIFATLSKRNGTNGFEQWIVSLEVIAVMVLVVVFSPILLILWLIDVIRTKRSN